nr:leucine-rich repeat domain-containing protein [uncultured Acetobacterium sp.]
MPQKLETIGPNAFWECSALENMVIPDTVKSIGYGVFARCDLLTSIVIPAQMRKIMLATIRFMPRMWAGWIGRKTGKVPEPLVYPIGWKGSGS